MHICFICREYPPSLRGGGIASYIKEMAKSLSNAGHKVTVICASDDTRKESQYKDGNINIIRLKGGNFIIPQVEKKTFIRRFRSLYRFHSYRKRIKEAVLSLEKVDIIEVAEFGAESYYIQDIGIPVVTRLHAPTLLDFATKGRAKLSLHNAPFYWQGLQELKLIQSGKYTTSCSSALKEWVVQNTSKCSEDIEVIYNPISCSSWSAQLEHPHINTNKNQIRTILCVGTICETKGCEDLAKACKLLHEQNPSLTFNVKFIGKMGNFAYKLQHRYGNECWFQIIGKVEREKLMKIYGEADVVCIPSWWENMPMVCLEAMICGSIVIGSNSGGMSEIIENGKSGFLLSPRQPQDWANKILEVFNMNDKNREQMITAAQQRIKTTFDTEVIVPQIIQYYKNVITNFKSKK